MLIIADRGNPSFWGERETLGRLGCWSASQGLASGETLEPQVPLIQAVPGGASTVVPGGKHCCSARGRWHRRTLRVGRRLPRCPRRTLHRRGPTLQRPEFLLRTRLFPEHGTPQARPNTRGDGVAPGAAAPALHARSSGPRSARRGQVAEQVEKSGL